jgi:hypothetical protein
VFGQIIGLKYKIPGIWPKITGVWPEMPKSHTTLNDQNYNPEL